MPLHSSDVTVQRRNALHGEAQDLRGRGSNGALRSQAVHDARRGKPARSRRLDILRSALLDSQGAVASHRATNYPIPVSGVEEIKQAIDKLSFKERCELMAVLAPPAYDEWDRQMLSDSERARSSTV